MSKPQAPAEPVDVTTAFERDPERAAMQTQIRAIAAAARDGALSLMEEKGRATAAFYGAASETHDSDMVAAFLDENLTATRRVADQPALDMDALVTKLAVLVSLGRVNFLFEKDEVGEVAGALAASALADAVLLRAGSIDLPEFVLVPARTPAEIAHWRGVAAALSADGK